jgi:hypothetical protein
MMKSRVYLLALPLMSTAACLDMSDQDAADVTSSQASLSTLDPAAVPAATPIRFCESHGQFCVGAPTIAFQDSVEETPSGRDFTLLVITTPDNGHFLALAFNADTNKCVAVKTNSDLVQVRACTEASNAFWVPERGPDGQSCIFRNQGTNMYLSGGNNASKFVLKAKGAKNAFQQFGIPHVASCADSILALF